MLTAFIIVFLWLCISGLIFFIIRNKKITLSFQQVLVFFGGKIVAGEVYGYIFKRFYNGDDTWGLHHDSLLQYQRLLHSPAVFIADIFSSHPLPATSEYYFQPTSYLENLEYCFTTKLLALFNILSQGNYYINVVLFNFLGFWGVYFLYKLLAAQLEPARRPVIAAVLFLFPPAIFWLSGIRAECLLLLFTGVLLWQFNLWLRERRFINAMSWIICVIMAVIVRNGFAFALLPGLAAWALTIFFKSNSIKTTVIVNLLVIAATIAGNFLLPGNYSVFQIIAARQHDFFTLHGNTRFALTKLDNAPLTFLTVFPQAAVNTFIRPFFWEAKGLLQWFAAFENAAVFLLAAITLLHIVRNNKTATRSPLFWFLLTAGITNYIIIGYIVPFPGAIVRYKIIPELFLISACMLALLQSNSFFNSRQRTTASLHI